MLFLTHIFFIFIKICWYKSKIIVLSIRKKRKLYSSVCNNLLSINHLVTLSSDIAWKLQSTKPEREGALWPVSSRPWGRLNRKKIMFFPWVIYVYFFKDISQSISRQEIGPALVSVSSAFTNRKIWISFNNSEKKSSPLSFSSLKLLLSRVQRWSPHRV